MIGFVELTDEHVEQTDHDQALITRLLLAVGASSSVADASDPNRSTAGGYPVDWFPVLEVVRTKREQIPKEDQVHASDSAQCPFNGRTQIVPVPAGTAVH